VAIFLKSFLINFLFLLVFDGMWLGVVAKNFYKKWIGHLMADSPNWLAGGLFYPLYVLGLTVFVVLPAVKNQNSLFSVFLLGALFGLVAYGTYDLTNQATLKNWPLIVTLVDLTWGAMLSGSISLLTTVILKSWE